MGGFGVKTPAFAVIPVLFTPNFPDFSRIYCNSLDTPLIIYALFLSAVYLKSFENKLVPLDLLSVYVSEEICPSSVNSPLSTLSLFT